MQLGQRLESPVRRLCGDYTGKLDVFKGVVEVDEALHADLREGERGTERWSEDVRKEFSDMSLERRGKRGEGNRG